MKNKFLPVFIVLGLIIVIVVVFISMSNVQSMVVRINNNIEQKPLKIEFNHYQDSDCGMVIENLKYTSEVVSPKGVTWFFHDHGGMVHWLSLHDFKDSAKIWVHSLDTLRWIDGRKAWYSRDEITPMENGFGAYEHKKPNLINFKQMKLYMLRGETMSNPAIKKQLLEEKAKHKAQ
jgi:hypothetical protein